MAYMASRGKENGGSRETDLAGAGIFLPPARHVCHAGFPQLIYASLGKISRKFHAYMLE